MPTQPSRTTAPAGVPSATTFMSLIAPWLCDNLRADIRYFAQNANGKSGEIVHAVVYVGWNLPAQPSHFESRIGGYRIGQFQHEKITKKAAEKIIKDVVSGSFTAFGEKQTLPGTKPATMTVDVSDRHRFENTIRVQLGTDVQVNINKATVGHIEDGLRTGAVPFDGLQDVFAWLGLPDPEAPVPPSSLWLFISPPADFDSQEGALAHGGLSLRIRANAKLDKAKISVALRTVPANGIAGRRQVTDQIVWQRPSAGVRNGLLRINTGDAEQALVMLSVGGLTCRRHWFTDPERARNTRLLAATLYDPDLKQLKSFLAPKKINGSAGPNFERGVAMLLHILGFTAAINCETEAPDITFITPGGAMAIVECTVQSHDVQEKAAKLHARRVSLEEAMRINNYTPTVLSILVCAMSRQKLDLTTAGLEAKRVLLITKEDIDNQLHQLRFPVPDGMYQRMLAKLDPPATATG